MMGGVIARGEKFKQIKKQSELMGQCSGPDDIYLAFRGLRTMKVRLEKSFNSSLKVADWISNQQKVVNVFHPATKYHPDFNIGAGLFSFELREKNSKKIDKFVDALKLFGIGASWGGFESLILEADLDKIRKFKTFQNRKLIRLSIGLEEPEDLIADLRQAFKEIN